MGEVSGISPAQPHPSAQFPTPLGSGRLVEGSPLKHPGAGLMNLSCGFPELAPKGQCSCYFVSRRRALESSEFPSGITSGSW